MNVDGFLGGWLLPCCVLARQPLFSKSKTKFWMALEDSRSLELTRVISDIELHEVEMLTCAVVVGDDRLYYCSLSGASGGGSQR